mgnify:CR=1 FL=1
MPNVMADTGEYAGSTGQRFTAYPAGHRNTHAPDNGMAAASERHYRIGYEIGIPPQQALITAISALEKKLSRPY